MNLAINTAFSEGDSEITLVTPGFIPAVGNDPMVSSPSNNFNGMTSQGFSAGISVDARLIVYEIFVNSKGGSHRSVLLNIGFDSINAIYVISRVAGFVFVITVVASILALFAASRFYLFNLVTIFVFGIIGMMVA